MYRKFGIDGGPAAKALLPKINVANDRISSKLSVHLHFNVRFLVGTLSFLKGFGGLLFVFGSKLGGYLLLLYSMITAPLFYDYYNYAPDNPEYIVLLKQFLQRGARCGALLYFIGMQNSIPKRRLRKKATPKPKYC